MDRTAVNRKGGRDYNRSFTVRAGVEYEELD